MIGKKLNKSPPEPAGAAYALLMNKLLNMMITFKK